MARLPQEPRVRLRITSLTYGEDERALVQLAEALRRILAVHTPTAQVPERSS